MKQYFKDAVMGVVTGDALGCPVQFRSREEISRNPVTKMRGYGTFNLPSGSWTDDSSLTIALLESLLRLGKADTTDIMNNFVQWLDNGKFTPYGYAYDIGNGTMQAILRYKHGRKAEKCGGDGENNNGNGSLMRIMPACLFCCSQNLPDKEAILLIHRIGSLTHGHIRSNIACGLYYFMTKSILSLDGDLKERLQKGLTAGFAFYEDFLADRENLYYYDRLKDLKEFAKTEASRIKSSGYVVHTLEAAVWCLITTSSFEEALLKAVNLGEDTDTVGAVAGGLAGLFYGYDTIPASWLSEIQQRDLLEEICDMADARFVPQNSVGTGTSKAAAEQVPVSRAALVEAFRDTQRMLREDGTLRQQSLETKAGTRLFLRGFEAFDPRIRQSVPVIEVTGDTTFHAAQPYVEAGKKTAVLNFANAYTPGGGVTNGARAQEECLCRSSSLYDSLTIPYLLANYYKWNARNTGDMGTDAVIYSPDVTVFRSDDMIPENLENWFRADVLTCAAPYYDPGKKKPVSMEQLEEVFRGRIRNILEVAAAMDEKVLVLGAFGCGAFNNPPHLVAGVFRELLIDKGYGRFFEKVIFAIKKNNEKNTNLMAFQQVFER